MPDKYPSLAVLKERLPADQYRIVCLDRRKARKQETVAGNRRQHLQRIADHQVTIIAPHGGFIEAGTSAIARVVAARRYNLFDFQGLQEVNPQELHVTSTNFRDPQLCSLLHDSAVALSIHGMGDQGHKEIWLGGLNVDLKELVLQNLRAASFLVNPSSPRYRGISQKNIVNLARSRGVQLELSNELMVELFPGKRFLRSGRRVRTTARFDELVRSLQLSVEQWCHNHSSDNPSQKPTETAGELAS